MKKVLQSFSVLCVLFFFVNHSAFGANADGFEKLKSLEGKWQGTAKWIGVPKSEFEINAVYSWTGKGTVVVEDLIVQDQKTMSSVYHMDGDVLRVTHYCGAGNQPRLRASSNQVKDGKLTFQMVDVTNLSSPEAPHVIGAQIHFRTQTEITVSFDFYSNGQTKTEFIELHRIQ